MRQFLLVGLGVLVTSVSCLFLHSVIRNSFSFLLQGQQCGNLGVVKSWSNAIHRGKALGNFTEQSLVPSELFPLLSANVVSQEGCGVFKPAPF